MGFRQFEKLTNLVRFRLTANLLKIDDLFDLRVTKDMMATADTQLAKSERFNQPNHIVETNVPRTRQDSSQQFSRVPSWRPRLLCERSLRRTLTYSGL